VHIPLRTLTGFVVLVALLFAREWTLMPDGKLHAYFLSIGQGDTIFLVLPDGKQVLIDGGPDWTALEKLGNHMSFLDRSIDLMILTHDHADHLVSLPEVAKRYRVQAVLLSGYGSSGRYKAMEDALHKQGTKLIPAHAGRRLELGNNISMDVLWPPSEMATSLVKNQNNVSVVTKLTYGEKSMLFTGDIEEIAEATLLKTGTDLHADLLKVGHHGSRTSSTEAFLKRVAPSLAVISSGNGNSYGHPHADVVKRYDQLGIEVRRTDLEGDVEVVW